MIMKAKKRNEGFTFIEIVIALMILTVGVMGSSLLVGWIARGANHSDRMSDATSTAQAKMEELLKEGFNNITEGSDTTYAFQRSWTITSRDNFKEVKVRVDWTTPGGKTHHAVVSSIFSDDTFTDTMLPSFIIDPSEFVPEGTESGTYPSTDGTTENETTQL
jgi:prepilin-type N-terminal cleavage/methylation domain-containing protein